ncbi:LysR family transcriptional regulator [Acidaminobacter sp. JC074]|uniref:LysR family transcriptional regulator n=1 Tax=Acidaminobacter sp. JC074 TaxID=2530199 RepID=UPI001F0E5B9C|nr:LysR family transcriptional regulator [Acidaminobacter sp. JC074]MCH4889928.1 LysR family transcriptional regulator [Acidaminobacter sp. JC074]
MDINFELYKIFYFTAINLSFTKASEQLYVTQSSVSQSIKQLETKLDTKLFIRYKKKISLTEEGQILLTHVSQAYQHLKAAERKIENYSLGEITIGASDTLCKYFLLPYFKKFHKKYPQIKINIINQPSRKTLQMIGEGLMDFGIVAISKDTTYDNIKLIKLQDYEEVCVVGEELHEKIGDKITLQELSGHPIITLRQNTNTRKYMDHFFKENGFVLEPEFEMVSVDLILEMVKADLGIGFAMDDTLKNQNDLYPVKLTPKLPTRQISFAISENLPLSNTAKDFMDHMLNNEPKKN